MKQFLFVILAAVFGMGGSIALTPVYGLAVYYLFSILRPQTLWEWVEVGGLHLDDFQWSFYLAVTTLLTTLAWKIGMWAPTRVATPPWYGNPKFTRSHFLFLAFTAWISLTYVTAVSQTRAWPYFIEYIKIFVMFICAVLVVRTVRDLWIIYYAALIAAVYLGYEVNAYYFFDKKLLLSSRGHGGLDNNGAALILGMSVPMCFFAWEANRHWTRWGFLLLVPMLIHGVLLSFSRGAMLSMLVASGVVWLRCRNKRFVSLIYALLAVMVLIMAGKEIRERFFSIEKHDVDGSAQARLTTWGIAITMANERPLFGFGIRNSNLFTYSYGADMEGRSIHSQYLQTAADSGWVALALYLGLLLSVFVGLSQVRGALSQWNDPDSARVKSLASGLESAIVMFCFGAIFLSLEHFEMPYVMFLLAIQLHAITRAVLSKLDPNSRTKGLPTVHSAPPQVALPASGQGRT